MHPRQTCCLVELQHCSCCVPCLPATTPHASPLAAAFPPLPPFAAAVRPQLLRSTQQGRAWPMPCSPASLTTARSLHARAQHTAPGPGLSQRSLCSSSALRSSSVRFASSTCFFFFCGGTVRLGNRHQQRAEQRSSTRLAVGRGSVLPCPAGRPPEPTSWRTLTTRALCPVGGRNRPRQSAMTRHLPSSSSPRRAPSPAAPL